MTQYRIFRRSPRGGLKGSPFLVSCSNDDAAMAAARQYNDGDGVAVWDGPRLVGMILVGL
jgi:hypothetical protein